MMAFIRRVFGIITVMDSSFEVRVTMCAHETRRLRDTLAGFASSIFGSLTGLHILAFA
jgi:tryptophan 2,3-dioxygenase